MFSWRRLLLGLTRDDVTVEFHRLPLAETMAAPDQVRLSLSSTVPCTRRLL
jgi:hypothetical protein